MGAKYSVTIGLNIGRTPIKARVYNPVIQSLKVNLSNFFGGATILRASGGWYDGTRFVNERSIVAYVLVEKDTDEKFRIFCSLADQYRKVLSQNSVLVERTSVDFKFVE